MLPQQAVTLAEATQPTPQSHQPDQDVFRAILPEEIRWQAFPAFPPEARLAVVVGEPSQEGLYTIRVKVPHGVKLMPHIPDPSCNDPAVTNQHISIAKNGTGRIHRDNRAMKYDPTCRIERLLSQC